MQMVTFSSAWPCADGDELAEQRIDGRRYGGDDHRHELRRGSDGNVWRHGGDQRGGGERHTITATTPAGSAGAATVTVTRWAERKPGQWVYLCCPPTVSSVSPNSGSTAGGTAVTITGTNFATGATVTFGSGGDQRGGGEQHDITATTPAGSAGAVTVTVTNRVG